MNALNEFSRMPFQRNLLSAQAAAPSGHSCIQALLLRWLIFRRKISYLYNESISSEPLSNIPAASVACFFRTLSPAMSVAFTGRCCARCSLFPSLRTLWPVAAATKQQQRGFTAPGASRDASATVSAPCAAAAEAFPFLRQQKDGATAAVPPSFGAMAASMTKEAAGRVQVVRDMDSFEAEVYRQPPAPLAIFFSATFSNLNKGLLEQFTEIAKASNNVAKFLVIDVDEVPRAAYHCGVRLLCNTNVLN